ILSTTGKPVAQLTHDSSSRVVEDNHWAFYPRFSPDGQTLFYDFDPKDAYDSFRVDLTIFASRIDPSSRTVPWTQPNDFTGGDISPSPLRDGGLIYTKYSIDNSFQVHSQLWTVGSSGPASVREITSDLGLDSTSAPVWMKG